MNNSKEYVLCAAYVLLPQYFRHEHRTNYKDKSLWDKYGKWDDIYELAIGRRHNDILQMNGDRVNHNCDGFYSSYGRYLTREEALEVALDAGQVTRDKLSQGSSSNQLFSEDLY